LADRLAGARIAGMTPSRAHAGLSLCALVCAAAGLGAAPGAAMAQSGALGDYFGPREIAVGEAGRADARGASATTLNPAGLALGGELVFEASYGRNFDSDSNIITASGCDSTVIVPGCYYYRYFSAGAEDGEESGPSVHEGGATLARAITPSVTIGASAKYFRYSSGIADDDSDSGFTFDVGTVVRPVPRLGLAVVGYHLVGADSPQYPRGVAAGLTVRVIPRLAISADGLWNLDAPDDQSTGRYGGGAEYFLTARDGRSGYPIRLGVIHDVGPDSTYLTGGLGLVAAKVGLDVGVRAELGGGDFIVQASLRLFGPRRIQGTNRFQ
ncbi:MAG: hypothetical protein AAGC55_32785, partial [Myxococcota bacterium]